MNEHETIRALLPLAASDDISPEDLGRVRRHLAQCEDCRRASDDFASLAEALRAVPTPQPSPELVARVYELANSRLALDHGRRSEARLIAPLVAASWVVAASTWPVVRAASAWMLSWWRIPGDGFMSLLAVYSAAGFLLASLAAVAVARCAATNGRTR